MAEKKAGGFGNRYKFNGKELDALSGLYYYGARFYDPVVGNWLSVDPLAEKMPGDSPYNYCFNNPINLNDPDGKLPSPFRLFLDLFKTFGTQTTNSILSNSYKQSFWSTGGTIQRLGRIYEAGVIGSLGERKNTKTFYSSSSKKGVIPDLVGSNGFTTIGKNNRPQRIEFENSSFVDAKMKKNLEFIDSHNPSQVKTMIDVLSEQKGGYVDGKYNPNIKPSDFGSATLTFITPGNTIIDPEIIKYATEKNVQLFQRTTQQDVDDSNSMRINGMAIPLNFVKTTKGVTNILMGPGQSEQMDWEIK